MQELIIIRGIPGSGKTTMAKSYQGYSHYEADMFFMKDGVYNFDRAKIKNAHNWSDTLLGLKPGDKPKPTGA